MSTEIAQSLTQLLDLTRRTPEAIFPFDLNKDRIVIFSDLHKGARNGADDFRAAERAYHAALSYYMYKGYTLIVLGDAEELWEERPQAVMDAYQHTMKLEARFHLEKRYHRVWGNHDDVWQFPDAVQTHLHPFYPGLRVWEGLILQVKEQEQIQGELFMVHGHQGTLESDRFSNFSRWAVRNLWRPIQRLFNISLNTPANDSRLRTQHDQALYRWAVEQAGLILIVGHTHRPVFKAKAHMAQIEDQIKAHEALLAAAAPEERSAIIERLAEFHAEMEWVKTQERQKPQESGLDQTVPCYFNSGCCCFSDGDITGLELADGHIRLVRWPDKDDKPRRHILESAKITDVLAEAQAKRQAAL
ncbi:MAG: metallophosphoesterase family protein [Chloroflexi bacterium]|nr:metallophosphoesterase family protein [Chloroflexota bacterium]